MISTSVANISGSNENKFSCDLKKAVCRDTSVLPIVQAL